MRHPAWKWAVCVLLLLATMLNYMDRLTVSQLSKEIIAEFELTERDYGSIDAVFSLAFALGALLVGWMADKWSVWWIYPAAVAAWSAAGAITGLVPAKAFAALLLCRFLLGVTEAGHWSCALKTTQRILPPGQRTMGNSLLQSGAAFGSVITPLVILAVLTYTKSWRIPFVVIGGFGLAWVVLWYALVRPRDLAVPPMVQPKEAHEPFLRQVVWDRRFWILVVLVISINITWHFFRVWLPRLLQKTHHIGVEDMNYFTAAYYVSASIGSLAAGFGTLLACSPRSIRSSKPTLGICRRRSVDHAEHSCHFFTARPAADGRASGHRFRRPGRVSAVLFAHARTDRKTPGQTHGFTELPQLAGDGAVARLRRCDGRLIRQL